MPTIFTLPFDTVVEHAVERLSVEFAGAAPPSTVRAIVAQARVELRADPPGALPELVERLARVRILELLGRDEEGVPGPVARVRRGRGPSRRHRHAPTTIP